MRTDPHRPWHAREIAAGLGLPHHRGLTGELSRWVKEGILCRAAPGSFTLHTDWIGPGSAPGHELFDTQASALTTWPWKYPDELRERAVKMVSEVRERDGKGHGELVRLGRQLGVIHATDLVRLTAWAAAGLPVIAQPAASPEPAGRHHLDGSLHELAAT
ncbi:MAG TPA: hypothetical protein VFW50_40520 [Streptosporangiaceae bacterium]|nr:hypothetical protein [Streptosporangiaceae bacterium]